MRLLCSRRALVRHLGFGLLEEMVLDSGEVKNPRLGDYILPTAPDVPAIETGIVDRPEATGPFGAKGVGEPTLLPAAPAIINAIRDAVGVVTRDLPATPQKILRELRAESGVGTKD